MTEQQPGTIVCSWNEWDPLKHVIVGRADGTMVQALEPAIERDWPDDGYPRGAHGPLPKDMEEAAMVDGCSRLGAIVRTLLPMSFPALVGAGLYTFLLAWNEFLFAVVLIESWDKRVLTIAIYSLLAEFVTEWSMMMAFSVLASAPLVVAFIFLQRYVVQGMTAGAIKS